MYNNFFGLKERPFKLVPNPAYLFLSRSHEEALAHLTYAINQGDGFVKITGEVGTGKTTLCRVFLETADKSIEAAYIFNPNLDSLHLLKAINDEFRINSTPDNTKELIDIFNAFLIEKTTDGKKVILIIDEAQNLSREVLEQLRLLSNLETTQNKLVQIILVGQPELREILDSYELRQLGQRITLSCHILPLTKKETRDYIWHRIHIAALKPRIKISWFAHDLIYTYSGGIPRLINIVCDRSLLTAYGIEKRTISKSIVKSSIRELSGRNETRYHIQGKAPKAIPVLISLCIILFIIIFYRPGGLDIYSYMAPPDVKKMPRIEFTPAFKTVENNQNKIVNTPSPTIPPVQEDIISREVIPLEQPPVPEPLPVNLKEPNLNVFLNRIDPVASRNKALKSAMDLWNNDSVIGSNMDDVKDDQTFFNLAAQQNGIQIHRIKGDFELIERLNHPAILEMYLPGSVSPIYLTISKIHGKHISLVCGDDTIKANRESLEIYWTSVAYITWKNFLSYSGIIPSSSTRDSTITLKLHLRDIGFDDIEISPVYDKKTRQAVKEIQMRNGIAPDGVVGPLTKIILYNEKKYLQIPHIVDNIQSGV